MIGNHEFMRATARRMGVSTSDLEDFFARGEEHAYEAGEWLFHESTPRQWAGVIISGEVEVMRGLHGTSRRLAVLGPGALIAESAFLGDQPHSTKRFYPQRRRSLADTANPLGAIPRRETGPVLPYRGAGGRGHQRAPAPGLAADGRCGQPGAPGRERARGA